MKKQVADRSIEQVTPEAEEQAHDESGSRIKSVALTIRLLNEMATFGGPIGVSELARRVGEAKARIHRHLLTLRDAGILMQSDDSERYRLGWKLFQLGQSALDQFSIVEIAAAPMTQLRDRTSLTVLLAQRAGDEVVVTETVESRNMIAVTARKGLRAPGHGSAGGRVMLAFSSIEDQEKALSRPLNALTQNTPTDPEVVRRQLERIRRQLYDFAVSESQYGINSLAAPVLDGSGHFVAAVAIIGTHAQLSTPPAPSLISAVQECAAQISRVLGSTAYDSVPDRTDGAEDRQPRAPNGKATREKARRQPAE